MTAIKTNMTADQYINQATSLTSDQVMEIAAAYLKATGEVASDEEMTAMIEALS